MKNISTDRTSELEARLKAIRILPTDCCVFFKARDGCLCAVKECRCCEFSKFEDKNQEGLCKFKK